MSGGRELCAGSEFRYITNAALLGVGFNQLTFNPPGGAFGVPATTLSQGLQYDHALLTNASLNPGLFPASPTVLGNPNFYIDPNAGRPARILQWSMGLQREVVRDLVVEANYVGNRGAWENATSLEGGLNDPNPAVFAKYGIDPTTSAGQATLTSTLGSTAREGFRSSAPLSNVPDNSDSAPGVCGRSRRAEWQITVYGAPLGDSWYNSLQVKATKRYSRGFSVISAFTWSRTEANPAGTVNNIFNRPNQKGITANDIPFIFNTGISYETQNYGLSNRYLKAAVSGWNLGGLFQYQAGSPIAVPTSSNNQSSWYGQNTLENRVPGQPLFLKNPNCHCINPTTDFILNPAAWANPPLGQYGTSSPYYTDYRSARRPVESMNLGRTFRIREGKSLEVRAEFFNIFNRLELNGPSTGSPQGARTCTNGAVAAGTNTCAAGGTSPSGFGAISYTGLSSQPRNGQLVARFRF